MNASDPPAVLFEQQGCVAIITLNRPQAINAINNEVRASLPEAIRRADRDPAVRVSILRGAGDRGFCAGADIKELNSFHTLERRNSLVHEAWIDALDKSRKPVIAAIHGFCLGGGLEIATACDIRMATHDAVFGFPEVGLGLITGAGGSQRLVRLVGLSRALDLFITTDRVDAREAWRIGLVTRLLDAGRDLQAEAMTLAQRIAQLPPAAVCYAKEAMRRGSELPSDAGRRLEVDLFALLMTTRDRVEAANAFREKRPPRFTGD